MDLLALKRSVLPLNGPQDMGGGGGGGSSPPATQSTTQTQDLPDWAKGPAQDVLAKGQALTDVSQNPYQGYGGERIAGFSPLQQQAMTGASNMKTGPAGFQQDIGGYMNPYLQMSLAPQLAEANRSYDVSGMNANAQATKAGAFGGGRQALMQSENERNRNMGLANIVGQGYNNAFSQAQNQYNTGVGQALDINKLQAAYGGQQQTQAQRGMDTAYQDFLTQKNYPYQQLSYMSNLIRGTPMGMNTASQVYQNPNPISQAAGLVGTAYMGNKIFNSAEGGAIKEPRRPAGLAELAIHQMG